MYDHILDSLRRGATDEALNAARDAVDSHHDDADAHRLLAMAQQQAGDTTAAMASIERAIALAPEDADLHLLRAGLLLGERQLDEAQAALARSTGLDPNQFPAYILQAQLALGRGDLDEAARLTRTAERIAPGHPQILAIEGMLALRRGDADRALSILTSAARQTPDDLQVLYALGFAYMAQGHLAFAEQMFRRVLDKIPDSRGLRALVAELVRQQNRPGEAAGEIALLLDDPAGATPALRRIAGELELAAGHTERALPLLRGSLAAQPDDLRTLQALVETWRLNGDVDDARNTLEAALATLPHSLNLWRARLAIEPREGGGGRAVIERWVTAMPDCLPALEAQGRMHDRSGDPMAAEAVARRIIEVQPGRGSAELRVILGLLDRDPDAAVDRIQALLAQTDLEDSRRLLRGWLGIAHDRAGRYADALETWSKVEAEVANARLPLPPPTAPRLDWPAYGPLPDPRPAVVLLWGPPGSRVEQLAAGLGAIGAPMCSDRFGANPPHDGVQSYGAAAALAQGELDPAQWIARWREALPMRGIGDGQLIDWLLWWDNALLLALRPCLPEAVLMFAVRDPRDMLLDWLAFGTPAQFALSSPLTAAEWLASVLDQVATLVEQELFALRLIRLDDIVDDPDALLRVIGEALDINIESSQTFSPGSPHFKPGHWRAYTQALAEPFALLAPVARRLGYPED